MHPVYNASLQLVCMQMQDLEGAYPQLFEALCRQGILTVAKLAASDSEIQP
jgi:hypothetical protein